jgi:tetratricopeptide (TPR) repeat protein
MARRVAELVWRQHFRIPEPAFWALLVIAAIGFSAETVLATAAWTFVLLLAVQGIVRWHWHRRFGRALVVTRYSTVRGQEGMAARVQELVMTSLQDKLPPALLREVHAVSAVVGPADRDFAVRLRRRLRADLLVHGRIDQRSDGGWAVFARVVQPANRSVIHLDWHTRDVTPARARWGYLFELLTPAKEVIQEEYPLEFGNELEAVVRGTAGQLAAGFHDDEPAEKLLRSALAKAPVSTSHQIDQLRVALAEVLARTDRREEGLNLLRSRAMDVDPSPALLRAIAGLLGPQRGTLGGVATHERAEAIAALRKAVAVDADPQRDMSLYNLALMLREGDAISRQEADALLDELMRTSSFYRRTWYLRLERGSVRYELGHELQAAGDIPAARREWAAAAKLYSPAIRARPRFRFFYQDGPRIHFLKRWRMPPVMYAHANDAHAGAGHRLRAWWYERRFRRARARMIRKGEKYYEPGGLGGGIRVLRLGARRAMGRERDHRPHHQERRHAATRQGRTGRAGVGGDGRPSTRRATCASSHRGT